MAVPAQAWGAVVSEHEHAWSGGDCWEWCIECDATVSLDEAEQRIRADERAKVEREIAEHLTELVRMEAYEGMFHRGFSEAVEIIRSGAYRKETP